MHRLTPVLTVLGTATAALIGGQVLAPAPTVPTTPADLPTLTRAVATVPDCSDYAPGAVTVTGTVPGVCYLPTVDDTRGEHLLDTAEYGTDIPRCVEDDWNSTGLPRCYTVRVTDGAVVLIDQDDNTIATLTA